MSTHPNAILLLVLKPHNTSRKTHREIMAAHGKDDDVEINGNSYHVAVMEDDYEDGYQITAEEGDIIVFDMVTYGYGERITWDELAARKDDLEHWATDVCARFGCTATYYVTANY